MRWAEQEGTSAPLQAPRGQLRHYIDSLIKAANGDLAVTLGEAEKRLHGVTERMLQASIIKLCQLFGIAWYHTYDSRRSARGWPDMALVGKRGFITRELKSDSGTVTAEQEGWGVRLKQAGVSWAVWRPGDLRSGRIESELRAIR